MRKNNNTFHVCVIGETDLSDLDRIAHGLRGMAMPSGGRARWRSRIAAVIVLALCFCGVARALAAAPEAGRIAGCGESAPMSIAGRPTNGTR